MEAVLSVTYLSFLKNSSCDIVLVSFSFYYFYREMVSVTMRNDV